MSKAINRTFGGASVLTILASASLPLAPRLFGVNFYTPYFFIIPIFFLFFASWALQNGKVRLSYAAKAYAIVPILMFFLHFLGDDRIEQLNETLPYIFGFMVFFTTLLIFRFFSVTIDILVTFAFLFLLVETPIVMAQSAGWSNFGIISSYFGSGEERSALFGQVVRVSGTFGNPNVLAQVYQLIAAIVVSHFLFLRRRPRVFLSLAVFALTGLVIVLTLSRSGLLFFVLVNSSIVIAFMREPSAKRSKGILFFMIAAITMPLMIFIILQSDSLTILSRFQNLETVGRLETYIGAISLLREPSVLIYGVGGGQFFEGAARYGIYFEYRNWIPPELLNSSVHNLTLKMLTEFGAIVSFLYALAVVGFIRIGLKKTWADSPREKMMFVMPLVFLFLIPFQLGTTGSSIWLISIFSIYFAVIENEFWKVKSSG